MEALGLFDEDVALAAQMRAAEAAKGGGGGGGGGGKGRKRPAADAPPAEPSRRSQRVASLVRAPAACFLRRRAAVLSSRRKYVARPLSHAVTASRPI